MTNSWTKTVRIIGVLDVKAGVAVHAKGGDRAHYRPVRSILHEGADPLGLARAYRDKLGLDAVYLADLDAIAGAPPDLKLIPRLPMDAWVDAGVREPEDGARLLDAGASVVVAGLETVRGPAALKAMIARFGAGRVAFSLDLRDGRPIVADNKEWLGDDPAQIAATAVGCGALKMIVMDLARVGSGGGIGTLGLIAAIRKAHPNLEIVAGGGIAGPDDLRAMGDVGVWGVLIGSALHDGRIGLAVGAGCEERGGRDTLAVADRASGGQPVEG